MAAMVQVWWGTGGNNRGHKKGPDSGYILKVESPGSGDRLDYGEKERPQGYGLSIHKRK